MESILKLKKALEEFGETKHVTIRMHDSPGPKVRTFCTDAVQIDSENPPPDSVRELIEEMEHVYTVLSLHPPFSDTAGPCDFIMDCSFGLSGQKHSVCRATWTLKEVRGVFHTVDMVSGSKKWELGMYNMGCHVSTGKEETGDLVLHTTFGFTPPVAEEVRDWWSRFLTVLPPEVADVITEVPTTDHEKLQFGRAHRHPLVQEALRKLRAVVEVVQGVIETKSVNIALRPGANHIGTDINTFLPSDLNPFETLYGIRKSLSTLNLVEGVKADTLAIYFDSMLGEDKAFIRWDVLGSDFCSLQMCLSSGLLTYGCSFVRVEYQPGRSHGVAEVEKSCRLKLEDVMRMWSHVFKCLPERLKECLHTLPLKCGKKIEFPL